jgi:HD-like signal output (HDOD) protein
VPNAITTIDELISKVRMLPLLPAGIAKLLELSSSSPDFFDRGCAIVRADPVLTAQILKLANSAKFAGQAPVVGVDKAFMRVGTRLIACTLAESQLAQVFDVRDPAIAKLWGMGALAANLARTLAESHPSVRTAPEVAYSFGLLHDIGYLVLITLYADRASDVILETILPSRVQLRREMDLLGATHTLAGSLAASHWGIPAAVRVIIRGHHGDAVVRATCTEEVNRAIELLAVVDDLVFLCGQVPVDEVPERASIERMFDLPDRQVTLGALGLGLPDLEAALPVARKLVEEQRVLLGLPQLPSLCEAARD